MKAPNPTIYQILEDTTRIFRKGKLNNNQRMDVEFIKEIFEYNNIDEVPRSGNFERIDLILADIIVDKAKAEQYRNDLVKIVEEYPHPDKLAEGMNFVDIVTAFQLDTEGKALRMMAMGKFLGLWDVMSLKHPEWDDKMVNIFAGTGGLKITGYKIPETYSSE